MIIGLIILVAIVALCLFASWIATGFIIIVGAMAYVAFYAAAIVAACFTTAIWLIAVSQYPSQEGIWLISGICIFLFPIIFIGMCKIAFAGMTEKKAEKS